MMSLPVFTARATCVCGIGSNLGSPPAYATVTVQVAEREHPEHRGTGWVTVSVHDTGPGIPEDQRRSLFREFTRLESGSQKAGAGIGLAISKRIAHALGGDITLESEVGRGSTFTLWLPLERTADASDEST